MIDESDTAPSIDIESWQYHGYYIGATEEEANQFCKIDRMPDGPEKHAAALALIQSLPDDRRRSETIRRWMCPG